MGGGEKGIRGAVDQSLQRDVISKILAPLIIRRPVRAQRAHVFPGLGRLEGRQWAALGDLASPVVLLERFGHVPRSLRIGPQVLRRHVAQYIVVRAAALYGAVPPRRRRELPRGWGNGYTRRRGGSQ